MKRTRGGVLVAGGLAAALFLCPRAVADDAQATHKEGQAIGLSGEGKIGLLTSLCTTADDRLLACDAKAQDIKVLDLTGKRLWTLVPKAEGDFNVPTPVAIGGGLLVTTENNGTRLYAFGAKGRIRPEPVARNEDLANDTQTPVVLGGLAFGSSGALLCLDLAGGLKALWQAEDAAFEDYCALIAGNGRLLILTVDGQLLLTKVDRRKYTLLGRLKLFGEEETEIWSHPALVGKRLYVRDDVSVACFALD